MKTNSRANERHPTIGLISTVTDGRSSYFGVVENVSAEGICISRIPFDFDDNAQQCVTIVKGPSTDHEVNLHPRWVRVTNRGMYKSIGFQISSPPASWEEFIERITNEANPFHVFSASEEMEM